MDANQNPFKVGERTEARSNQKGYRGAWFRCMVKHTQQRKNEPGLGLEYYDFPDEKIKWTQLYQRPVSSGYKMKAKKKVMVRPCFPLIYKESMIPDYSTISEVVVIVKDTWKLGDLVDWFTDGCFWSGRITEVLGDDKFRIELAPPPYGEGSTYEASSEDMRPSLDWTMKDGWTVPHPVFQGNEAPHSCARLIKPKNLGKVTRADETGSPRKRPLPEEQEQPKPTSDSDKAETDLATPSFSESKSTTYLDSEFTRADETGSSRKRSLPEEQPKPTSDSVKAETNVATPSFSDNVSSYSHVEATSADANAENKMIIEQGIYVDQMSCDTVVDAITQLEELVNRIKWTKRLLQSEIPSSDDTAWKFVGHRS